MKFAHEQSSGGKKLHRHAKKSHKLMKKMAKLEKKLRKYNFDSTSSENDSMSGGDDSNKQPRSRSRSRSQKRMWARRYRHHKFEKHCRSSSSSSSSSNNNNNSSDANSDSSDSITFSSSSSRSPSPRIRRCRRPLQQYHHRHRHHGPAVHFARSRSFAGHDNHSPGRRHRHERHAGGRHSSRRHYHAQWAQHGIEGRLFRIIAQSEPNLPDVSSETPNFAGQQEFINLGSPGRSVNDREPEAPMIATDPTPARAAPVDEDDVQVINNDVAAFAAFAERLNERLNSAEGAEIDETLAENWMKIMREGLPLNTRKSLLEKYPLSKNCALLAAPKLNAGIVPIATDAASKRDTAQAFGQLQVGSGLTALGQAITSLNSKPEIKDQIADCVETLNEAAVILLSAHAWMSKVRQVSMKPELSKRYRSVVEDCKPDEFLYGKDFAEKIKSAKFCKKKYTDKEGGGKAEKRKRACREWEKKKSKRADSSFGPFKKGF